MINAFDVSIIIPFYEDCKERGVILKHVLKQLGVCLSNAEIIIVEHIPGDDQPDPEAKDQEYSEYLNSSLTFKRIIDDSLDTRLEPVIKEMIKAQQKTSLTEVIGGIGYIFGIMGIILYFLSKKGH